LFVSALMPLKLDAEAEAELPLEFRKNPDDWEEFE